MLLAAVHLRTLLLAGGSLASLVLIGVVFLRWLNPLIRLRVVNDTESPLLDVHLAYPGGTRWVARVLPDEEALWDIRSTEGSFLVISYRNTQGLLVSRRFGLDMQREQSLDVELRVQPAGIHLVSHPNVEHS